jgi:hypothetical protein
MATERIFHPKLPGVNLSGYVWVIPGRAGIFNDEDAADIVDEKKGMEHKVHVVGHRGFTYGRVFGREHKVLQIRRRRVMRG